MDNVILAAFEAAWTSTPELASSLTKVSSPICVPSPSAPGMQSVAGHFEFRDGARFKVRYSYAPDPNENDCFLSVEDDVGLHFGFLDDINAYLLDVDVSQPPEKVVAAALTKAVKMHTRASAKAAAPATATNGPTMAKPLSSSRRGVGRSAGYRIEDHPLAALLASQQFSSRYHRRPNGVLGPVPRLPEQAPGAAAVVGQGVGAPAAALAEGGDGGGDGDGDGQNENAAGGPAGAAVAGSSSDKKRNGVSLNFGSSRLATTALMQQLRILKKQNTREDGFSAEPKDDDLYTWDVKLYFDDPDTSLSRDLASIDNVDHLSLEFKFPSSFPQEPPVVRFISPLIIGGHVTCHGAICMELLTSAGWTPVNSIDAVCIQIRALLIAGNARIDTARPLSTERYTLEGALRDLSSIVFSHGWNLLDRFELDAQVKRPRNNDVGRL